MTLFSLRRGRKDSSTMLVEDGVDNSSGSNSGQAHGHSLHAPFPQYSVLLSRPDNDSGSPSNGSASTRMAPLLGGIERPNSPGPSLVSRQMGRTMAMTSGPIGRSPSPREPPPTFQPLLVHAEPHLGPFMANMGALTKFDGEGHQGSQRDFLTTRRVNPINTERPLQLFRFEDFDLQKTLGTGTFGRVQLARYKSVEKYFAMKSMRKAEIIRLKQVEHVFSEKYLLSRIHCTFIVRMFGTFQDAEHLYMLLEYASGGELFTYLRKAGKFNLATTQFYAAEIVLALEYLHARNIVYRDLKPENLLLDSKGHIKITDFGFAKIVSDRTWTLCGTPEYLAPEIISSRGHGKAVDWWALGILIYEMLAGYPPFYDETPFGIYERILAGRYDFPPQFDMVTADLVRRLLIAEPSHRLGNLQGGPAEIKRHPFFQDIDWEKLQRKETDPPMVPTLIHPGDTSNFEQYEEAKPSKKTSDIDPYYDIFRAF